MDSEEPQSTTRQDREGEERRGTVELGNEMRLKF